MICGYTGTMTKNVLITIKSNIDNGTGEPEQMELTTIGSYFLKNGAYYLCYKESPMSGLGGSATTVKADPARVTINRSGSVSMKQVFEAGVAYTGRYATACGNLRMDLLPLQVEVHLTDLGGSINLKYELALERQKIGFNVLEITVKEV